MLRLRGLCFKCLKSEQDFPASTLSCEITVTIKFRGRKESIPFIDGLQLFVKGTLCKFLSLGTNPERPCAGHHSAFRQLYVEANGGQPVSAEVTVSIFEKLPYEITVETVTRDRNGKERKPEHWYSIIREIHVARALPTAQHINTSPVNLSTPRTQSTYLTDQHNTENTPRAEREKQRRNSAFVRAGVSQ